jgi:succinate dehydrogenase / fumarate reductase cytochrome b subunit
MQNRFNNKLGVKGWITGGSSRFGPDRYAYTLHRITGLAILAYFLMHIFVTGSRLHGEGAWNAAMSNFHHPIFKLGEFLVYLAFAFHAINGIRLVVVELGQAIGKPGVPAYPYSYSAMRQKPFLVAAMIVAALLMAAGGVNLFSIG